MNTGQVNLLVFREDRRRVSGSELMSALASEMESCGPPGHRLRALLRAGELECGVADAAPELLANWERVTDKLADALISRESSRPGDDSALLRQAEPPPYLHISKPEGFAYYGLHPLAYAAVLGELGPLPPCVALIGIRSVGTTLSAIMAAAARRRGLNAARITVRPTGHPYNRHTIFSPPQLAWVQESLGASAAFLVVDEGPGLSGSSFLSVAEALVEAGAPAEKITLICGHEPELKSLCSDNGPQRASRFRWVAVDNQPRVPDGAEVFIGGGEWRRSSFAEEQDWPASWTSLERLKYLSPAEGGERQLFKFAGFGHYGDAVIEREREAAEAGFGPITVCDCEGFAVYPWLHVPPMRAGDLSQRVLSRLAEYCAFRAQAFPSGTADLDSLQQMAEHNLNELGHDLPVTLRLARPIISDGRMQPHEWLLAADGRMLKTDSGSHGDDHFFPGPTDIAWDLAGAIVEWDLDESGSAALLREFSRLSGDHASSRIEPYLLFYSIFRMAFCRMAAASLAGSEEAERLRADYRVYREKTRGTLQRLRAS